MSETVELVALFGLGRACESSLRDTIRRGCVVHHQERDIVGLCCTALEEPERVDDSITHNIGALRSRRLHRGTHALGTNHS